MPKAPYFSQYVSPNIVIVPTECCYGPPKKPKLDKDVLHQNPDTRVENCLKPNSFKIPHPAVTNQNSENSATNNQELKQSMQTSLQNEVPTSIARDVNKNTSAVDNNLNKTTKQVRSSWASNYLLSIGQLHKKNIKLNSSPHRKNGLTSREDTSACTAGMNSKEETNKTSSIINDKERRTAITMNYKIPFKTSTHSTPKFDSKQSKLPSEKTGTIVNQISTDTKLTKPPIKCDSKNITPRDKITEHITLQNSDNKRNTENRPEFSRPESNKKATTLSSSSRRNSESKNEKKHEKDRNKTKSKDLSSKKHLEGKKKDKNKPESTTIAKTYKPAKIQDSENNKSRHMNSASKSSAAHSKNERLTKPLKISNFILNDTEKNLATSKRSKSSKISRDNRKEDKYVKNRKGSTKNKKDHSFSSTKKSLDLGIKKKSKKCTLDTEKISKSKIFNLKPSKTFSSTIKDSSFDDHRSSSKDSIKSVVQLTDNRLHHKHKIDENFDLRTKLSPKGLNHYFTKIQNSSSKYSIPEEERENLIITVQNKNGDDNERMHLKNVHELYKDSKDISVSREYKKIKLVINLICPQPPSHKPDKNENCGLTNEDVSFLDDFNVDEIVETLKHCENESIGAKHNVELDIEVHTGLEKTNPVSMDIRENKINYSVPETTGTIVRSRRESSGNKCTKNLPQNLSPLGNFVKKVEKYTHDDTLVPGTIQETNSKQDAPDTLHNKNIYDTNATENILKDLSSSNKIIQQLPAINDVQLQETVNVVKIECVEVMEAKLIKNSTKTANSEHEVSTHETPVINNIKKEPDIEANDKSDKISNKDFASIGGKNNDSSLLGQIKSEPQSNSMLSNTLDNFDLREKLRESRSHVEAVDNLPEVTNVNINCLHEDDDNASDVTLVLSPPHFGDFSLIDLTNELDFGNVSEIENYVKKEIETTGKTADKLLDDPSLSNSSNELSIEKVCVSDIENYVKKEIETTGKTVEKRLDDVSLIESSNELSIEKVTVSEIKNYVKKEIETTGKTAEKRLDDFSLIDSSNELSIEKVTVSEIENYVKKEIETTGKTVEKRLDDVSLIESSNELSIEKVTVSEIENYVKKEIETTGKTAEKRLDDFRLIDSSNDLSIEKVSVSEIENYVKKEIETTGKTVEKRLIDLSLIETSNELRIEKVSVSEIENYVKKEIETTGKTAEKRMDDLSLIDSSNKLSIEKVNNVETHLETDVKDIESTKSIPPDSVAKPTETTDHTESLVSNTPNVPDASKTSESKAFSNTIKSEGSSDLEKYGKRKNEYLQNEPKSKILKVGDCVSNTSGVSVCDKKEQKDDQQNSKMSQSEIMSEPDKLSAQNLQQRMLSYLREEYTITSIIHKGTFSKIFNCKNSYGKDFAVKVINSESERYNLGVLKENMLMKIQQEIPKANYNCVHIYNGFSLTGFWCFLMEYYPKNLMQAISKKKRPFHINVVQNLARQLVAAVTVLRNYNIVHTDICPRHVLLNHSNSKLKLCGFDESYYIDCAKLVPNIGTASYRAPEVILGFSAGYSIDVWSTALVIYEMATGIQLFPGCFNNDILFKQMCTLGNIPDDMVKKSLYKYSHFSGPTFMRKAGARGKKVVFIKEFFKSNRLHSTIFNKHKRYNCSPSMLKRTQYCEKLETLCSLLEGMLVLHPNHRLAIEFVYSNPFVYNTFYDRLFKY